jgi:hypothetical protein
MASVASVFNKNEYHRREQILAPLAWAGGTSSASLFFFALSALFAVKYGFSKLTGDAFLD